MSVRTRLITMPRSLNESLASSSPKSVPEDPSRSSKSATNSQASFPERARSPLASHRATHQQGITFASQDKLPKLPIPDLKNTCRRYLAALEPLQTAREHEESKAAVQEFLKSDGPDLDERLRKYATGKTSFIEQFCKYYLSYSARVTGGY